MKRIGETKCQKCSSYVEEVFLDNRKAVIVAIECAMCGNSKMEIEENPLEASKRILRLIRQYQNS